MRGTVVCTAVLAGLAAASFAAQSAIAADNHRLAFSKRLGLEVLANKSAAGAWCGPKLDLEIRSKRTGLFTSRGFAPLMGKIGSVIARECPAAKDATLRGTSADGKTAVYAGTARAAQGWAPVAEKKAADAGIDLDSEPVAKSAPARRAVKAPQPAPTPTRVAPPPANVVAGQFAIPHCSALSRWASGLDRTKWNGLANILADGISSPVFGVPARKWTTQQAGNVRSALAKCSKADVAAAGKDRRKRASVRKVYAYAETATGQMANAIGRWNRMLKEYRIAAKALAGLPESSKKYQAYGFLAELHETGDARAIRTKISRSRRLGRRGAVPARLNGVVRAAQWLVPETLRELTAGAKAESEAIRGRALTAAGAEIDKLPAETRSLLTIRARMAAIRQGYGDGADVDSLQRAADRRTAAVTAETRQQAERTGTAQLVFPKCEPYKRWADRARVEPWQRLRVGAIKPSFRDESVLPLFGKSIAQWTNEDVDHYAAGYDHCRALLSAGQTGRQARFYAPTKREIASRARPTLVKLRDHNKAVADLRQKIADMPAGDEGLRKLTVLARNPGIRTLTHTERAQIVVEVKKRQAALAAAMIKDMPARLDAFKSGMVDLQGLGAYGVSVSTQIMPHLGPSEKGSFQQAFAARHQAIAPSAVGEFKSRLADIPESRDGVMRARQAVGQILPKNIALRLFDKMPPHMEPFRKAADTRAESIIAALHENVKKKFGAGSSSFFSRPVGGNLHLMGWKLGMDEAELRQAALAKGFQEQGLWFTRALKNGDQERLRFAAHEGKIWRIAMSVLSRNRSVQQQRDDIAILYGKPASETPVEDKSGSGLKLTYTDGSGSREARLDVAVGVQERRTRRRSFRRQARATATVTVAMTNVDLVLLEGERRLVEETRNRQAACDRLLNTPQKDLSIAQQQEAAKCVTTGKGMSTVRGRVPGGGECERLMNTPQGQLSVRDQQAVAACILGAAFKGQRR